MINWFLDWIVVKYERSLKIWEWYIVKAWGIEIFVVSTEPTWDLGSLEEERISNEPTRRRDLRSTNFKVKMNNHNFELKLKGDINIIYLRVFSCSTEGKHTLSTSNMGFSIRHPLMWISVTVSDLSGWSISTWIFGLKYSSESLIVKVFGGSSINSKLNQSIHFIYYSDLKKKNFHSKNGKFQV